MIRSFAGFFGLGAAALAAALLGGCGNGGASEPLQTSVDPAANSKLQFSVGVATLASANGSKIAYGLNEVETLRQSDGLSGTLYNVPMIIGPTTFDVLNSTQTGQEVQSAGNDLGTNHITWGTLNQSTWIGPLRGLKQSSSGAFGYGLCPCNSDSGPVNGTSPLYQAYTLPIYGNDEELWYGGPPAFPQAGPTLIASGMAGLLARLHDLCGAAGDRRLPSLCGRAAVVRYAGESHAEPQSKRLADAAARSPRGGRATGIARAAAALRNARVLAGRQGRRKACADGSGRCERSAGRGVCAPRRQRRLRPVPHNGFLLHARHAQARRADVWHLPTISGRLRNRDRRRRRSATDRVTTFTPPHSTTRRYESSYPQNLSELPLIKGPNGQADVSTSDKLFGLYP